MNLRLLPAALAVVALGACTVPTADDIHTRSSSSAFMRDTREYRSMDNNVYDVMAETFGREKVFLSEFPEKEYHAWVFHSDEKANGLERMRTRVQARPMKGGDGHWVISVQARMEMLMKGDSFGRSAPAEFGTHGWLEMGRDTKLEARIANAVNERQQAWVNSGRPEVGNRRDEYLAWTNREKEAEASGK